MLSAGDLMSRPVLRLMLPTTVGHRFAPGTPLRALCLSTNLARQDPVPGRLVVSHRRLAFSLRHIRRSIHRRQGHDILNLLPSRDVALGAGADGPHHDGDMRVLDDVEPGHGRHQHPRRRRRAHPALLAGRSPALVLVQAHDRLDGCLEELDRVRARRAVARQRLGENAREVVDELGSGPLAEELESDAFGRHRW